MTTNVLGTLTLAALLTTSCLLAPPTVAEIPDIRTGTLEFDEERLGSIGPQRNTGYSVSSDDLCEFIDELADFLAGRGIGEDELAGLRDVCVEPPKIEGATASGFNAGYVDGSHRWSVSVTPSGDEIHSVNLTSIYDG